MCKHAQIEHTKHKNYLKQVDWLSFSVLAIVDTKKTRIFCVFSLWNAGQRQYYDRFNMESANKFKWMEQISQKCVGWLSDTKTNFSRFFFTVVQENGSRQILMEDVRHEKWKYYFKQVEWLSQSVLDIFGHKKQEYFCVFDCEMQRKWVRDNLMEDLACKVKIPSQQVELLLQSVLDDLWAQNNNISCFSLKNAKRNGAETNLMEGLACKVQTAVSDEWKSSHLSVSDNLQNQNWPIWH